MFFYREQSIITFPNEITNIEEIVIELRKTKIKFNYSLPFENDFKNSDVDIYVISH